MNKGRGVSKSGHAVKRKKDSPKIASNFNSYLNVKPKFDISNKYFSLKMITAISGVVFWHCVPAHCDRTLLGGLFISDGKRDKISVVVTATTLKHIANGRIYFIALRCI